MFAAQMLMCSLAEDTCLGLFSCSAGNGKSKCLLKLYSLSFKGLLRVSEGRCSLYGSYALQRSSYITEFFSHWLFKNPSLLYGVFRLLAQQCENTPCDYGITWYVNM